MARYVRVKLGKRTIIMRNTFRCAFCPDTEIWRKAADADFLKYTKKKLSKNKKEFKNQQIVNLNYLGISDRKLLNKLVRCDVDKLIDSWDKTEEAIKSNEKIYELLNTETR